MQTQDGELTSSVARRHSRRAFVRYVAGAAVAIPLAGLFTTPDAAEAKTSRRQYRSAKIFNVRHFGAQGDGRSDDAPAIQGAIDAAARTSGSIVFLPAGTYSIDRTLTINRPVRIVGESRNTTAIVDPYGMHIIEIWNTRGVEIDQITIQGALDTSDFGYALRTNDVENLNVRRCRFINIPDTAISLGNARHVEITECHFETIGTSGIRLQDPGDGYANHDILIQDNTFTNIVTSHKRGHAAIQSQGGAALHERITVTGNHIESQYVGIGLDSLDYSSVADNRVLGNLERGEGIAFTGSHNLISGNVINSCGAAGILQWGVAYRPNGDNRIEGNTCWDNAQGIAVVCGEPGTLIENLAISGNRCYSESSDHPQKFGVQSYINPTRDFVWKNVSIVDNDLRGNAVGPINLIPPSEARIERNLL